MKVYFKNDGRLIEGTIIEKRANNTVILKDSNGKTYAKNTNNVFSSATELEYTENMRYIDSIYDDYIDTIRHNCLSGKYLYGSLI